MSSYEESKMKREEVDKLVIQRLASYNSFSKQAREANDRVKHYQNVIRKIKVLAETLLQEYLCEDCGFSALNSHGLKIHKAKCKGDSKGGLSEGVRE